MLKRLTLLFALALVLPFADALAATGLPKVTWTQTVTNVTGVSGEVLAANSDRRWALIQNLSDTDIDCKVGATAVADEGTRLAPNGSLEISPRIGNLTTVAINCIQTAGGNKVMSSSEAEQ